MLRALEHAQWLASSAGQQPGGARFPRDRWDWALSVCHSRTFGAPGRGGGVGVRMLVPLIDMLNHAGDVDTAPPGTRSAGGGDPAAAVQARENVRWDLKAPAGPDGEWAMEVTATRAIAPGEELLLSYGAPPCPLQLLPSAAATDGLPVPAPARAAGRAQAAGSRRSRTHLPCPVLQASAATTTSSFTTALCRRATRTTTSRCSPVRVGLLHPSACQPS